MNATHKVVLSPEAEDDLDGILAFVRQGSGSDWTALRYGRRIRAACASLSLFPERGTRRDDLRPGLRTMGFERRATIAFAVGGSQVTILRILYGGRDVEAAFGEGG